jgi:uncharacterized protein
MTMRGYYSDSTVRKDANQRPAAESSPAAPPSLETGKQCAYNQTRERFLSAAVEAVDFSASSLVDNRLPALGPGAGLWLTPFVGISATSVRTPIDLIYLDRNSTVVDAVESFPFAPASSIDLASVSVLALPAETIRTTETQLGDQLIVCAPEEMKQRLKKLANPGAEAKADASAARNSTGRVLQWEGRAKAKTSAAEIPVEPAVEIAVEPAVTAPAVEPQAATSVALTTAPASVEPAETVAAPQKAKYGAAKPQRSWLQKLLSPDPPDARKTVREELPGLKAFFFTGGAPMAHGVRDISLTGMYVYTSERWYPGTMVRMTITDSSERSAERSITLNTTVVRSGDDGVGLRFVLERGGRQQADGLSYAASPEQVQEFLLRVKSAQK